MNRLSILIPALTLLSTACIPTETIEVTPPQNNISTMLKFRGEICTQVDECREGLACQGGICQATCAAVEDCASYDDTYCIAPIISQPEKRFCLKINEYSCGNILPEHNYCSDMLGEGAECIDNECTTNVDSFCDTIECDEGSFCDESARACLTNCIEDDECPSHQYCATDINLCTDRQTCDVDADCDSLDDACVPSDDDADTRVCTTIASCQDAEIPDLWCQRNQGTLRTQCNAQGSCEDIIRPNTIIQIVDLSSSEACSASREGLGEPGADIIAVELFAQDGSLISHGKLETFVQGTGDNDFISGAHLNGQEPDIDNLGCPLPDETAMTRFRADSVLSLGCNGYATFSFPDQNLEAIPLLDEMTIGVSEYAPVCDDPQSEDAEGIDRYEVYLCEDLDDDGVIINAECDKQLSDLPSGGYSFWSIGE